MNVAQRAWRWVGLHPWLVTFLVVIAGNVGAWRAIQAEADERQESSCENASAGRSELRDIVKESNLATGTGVGEALVRTFPDADPEDVEALRRNLVAVLTPELDDIVNELPDRQWVDGTCVDVPVGD